MLQYQEKLGGGLLERLKKMAENSHWDILNREVVPVSLCMHMRS